MFKSPIDLIEAGSSPQFLRESGRSVTHLNNLHSILNEGAGSNDAQKTGKANLWKDLYNYINNAN